MTPTIFTYTNFYISFLKLLNFILIMKKNYTAVVNMTKKFWHKNMTKFSQLLKQNVRNDASKYVNRINGLIEIALYLTSSK